MAIRVSCPFVVGGPAGSPRAALHVAPRPGSPHHATRLSLARTVSERRDGGARDLRWPPDEGAAVVDAAALAPAGGDDVARVRARARPRHGAAARAADLRRHRAGPF